jgi:hypothetical protein
VNGQLELEKVSNGVSLGVEPWVSGVTVGSHGREQMTPGELPETADDGNQIPGLRRKHPASNLRLALLSSVPWEGKCLCSASSNKLHLGLGDQNSRGRRTSRFRRFHSTSLTHYHGGLRRGGLIFSSLPTL